MLRTLISLLHFPQFLLDLLRSNNLAIAINGGIELLRRDGPIAFLHRLVFLTRNNHLYLFTDYAKWIEKVEANLPRPECPTDFHPKISIILPVYNPPPRFLRATLDSVLAQSYTNWELCIADDASPNPAIRTILLEYQDQDPRLKLIMREKNGHISAASNSALGLSDGEYLALLDHDDVLPVDALAWAVTVIAKHRDTILLYSDEDLITAKGKRFGPVFKPAWDATLMLQRNFFSHFGIYRSDIVHNLGGFREGFEGSQDWDLALRISEHCRPEQIRHIPRILYHWRAIPGSTALHLNEKNYAVDAGLRAVRDHLERRRSPLLCDPTAGLPFWQLQAPPSPATSVCLLLQSGDHTNTFPVGETGDQQIAVRYANEFAEPVPTKTWDELLNNHGAICVLHPALHPHSPNWLAHLVGHALRPEVGMAGGSIWHTSEAVDRLHPSAWVQDAHDDALVALYAGIPDGHKGYFDLAELTQAVAQVSHCAFAIATTTLRANKIHPEELLTPSGHARLTQQLAARGQVMLWAPHVRFHCANTSALPTTVLARNTSRALNPNLCLRDGRPALRFSTISKQP